MGEWLTTGQMIDKLKSGDVAENEVNEYGSKFQAYWEFDINRRTDILKFKDVKTEEVEEYLQIEDQNEKWRILPTYVSFEEAMRALEEGKIVELHGINNRTFRFKAENEFIFGELSREGITFADLIEAGKWTIEN